MCAEYAEEDGFHLSYALQSRCGEVSEIYGDPCVHRDMSAMLEGEGRIPRIMSRLALISFRRKLGVVPRTSC